MNVSSNSDNSVAEGATDGDSSAKKKRSYDDMDRDELIRNLIDCEQTIRNQNDRMDTIGSIRRSRNDGRNT